MTTPLEVLASIVGAVVDVAAPGAARWNIAPSQTVPIVRTSRSSQARVVQAATWGFVPSWSSEATAARRPINARCETAATNGLFRDGMRRGRCLVPIDGFFEWRPGPHGKQPMLIRDASGAPLFLGGVSAMPKDADGGGRDGAATGGAGGAGDRVPAREAAGEDGHRLVPDVPPRPRTMAILTCAADEQISVIHDRMPLMLPASAWTEWLDPAIEDPAELASLLQAAGAPDLTVTPVSTVVNRPANDDPRCVEPIPAADVRPGFDAGEGATDGEASTGRSDGSDSSDGRRRRSDGQARDRETDDRQGSLFDL